MSLKAGKLVGRRFSPLLTTVLAFLSKESRVDNNTCLC